MFRPGSGDERLDLMEPVDRMPRGAATAAQRAKRRASTNG